MVQMRFKTRIIRTYDISNPVTEMESAEPLLFRVARLLLPHGVAQPGSTPIPFNLLINFKKAAPHLADATSWQHVDS